MIRAFATAVGMSLALSACSAWEQADRRSDTLAAEAERHRGSLAAHQRGGVVEVEQPFYGGRASPTRPTGAHAPDRGQPLPEELEEPLGVDIQASAAGLATIQEILAGATELDVVVRTRYPTATGVIEVPVSGTMSLTYRGPLSGILDRIGSKFDLAWSFDGTAIRFDRMVSVTHDVPLPATVGELGVELSGVTTNSASIRASQSLSVDPWAEIERALEQAVAPPATVAIARNTGKITVFGPPSVQRGAARVIDQYAEVYSTRIGLEIATYFIDATETEDWAIGTFLQGAFGDGNIALGRGLVAAGSVGNIAIVGGRLDGSTINFRALATDKDVVDYRLSNTIGQNGIVAPVSLLTTQNYVRETTREDREDGSTKLTVKVDTIDTGLSIFALPRLLPKSGQVQLSLWILEASLNSLDNFGDVQLPKTDQRSLEYTVVLTPGETLVIGGYEQETVRKNRSGTGVAEFLGLGGSAKAEVARTSMVVLVRPTIIGS